MLLTCLVFRFHRASYLQICPVHFWIEPACTTSMQMILIFLLNSQGSPLEWKRWNIIAWNIRKDYACYLQKQSLKKKKKKNRTELQFNPWPLWRCQVLYQLSCWLHKDKNQSTRNKSTLTIPLILKKIKLLLWHFHIYRFDARNVVIFDATLIGSPMGYARKEQSFAPPINLFPF